jgi:hypothetical protein
MFFATPSIAPTMIINEINSLHNRCSRGAPKTRFSSSFFFNDFLHVAQISEIVRYKIKFVLTILYHVIMIEHSVDRDIIIVFDEY